ncbi:serine hydrolase [Patescibacteria group bacterium]|nr:serine hydrolase [Patescibacteria group bacterium]MBU0964019.1 serine hydrolase [Patescibacteria group bacterium]
MISYLLATLLYINNIDNSQEILRQDFTVQDRISTALISSPYKSVYKISHPLPPLKKSDLVFPAQQVTARSAIAIDNMSGLTLWENNTDEVLPIASLTKLMTALVFIDHKVEFAQEITIEEADNSNVQGSRLYVQIGEKMTVGDLFHASLVGSANNATKALARSTGLSEEEFISEMNKKAEIFGLVSTVFYDVTGLDPKNQSTAKEYSLIARHAFGNTLIREALGRGEYSFATLEKEIHHTIQNTNMLLTDPELNLIGAKTGYLNEAGFTYVCQSEKNGNGVIIVLLNSATSENRFTEAKEIIKWSHNNYIWI